MKEPSNYVHAVRHLIHRAIKTRTIYDKHGRENNKHRRACQCDENQLNPKNMPLFSKGAPQKLVIFNQTPASEKSRGL